MPGRSGRPVCVRASYRSWQRAATASITLSSMPCARSSACVSRSPRPTMRRNTALSRPSPNSSAASLQQASATRSLSIIRPSMSKMTASGRNGSAAIVVMERTAYPGRWR
ncbi:hypothetical protein G6F51_014435 [Rhizopus arrhizus]|uniref:Uncharacterized protein n=1 Tax=Rhizopus oryzae TaxID=64495 RepID=A0A9P6XM14_RHIOR|nr:hypothetical protein G6F51_014435 [Rhizopus arrhizus]